MNLLNVDELAKYLKRSPSAIRNLVMRRQIPFRKVAGRLIFFQEEIDKWLLEAQGITLEEMHKM
jgi:excisionase family DNA binding protein